MNRRLTVVGRVESPTTDDKHKNEADAEADAEKERESPPPTSPQIASEEMTAKEWGGGEAEFQRPTSNKIEFSRPKKKVKSFNMFITTRCLGTNWFQERERRRGKSSKFNQNENEQSNKM